MEKHALAVVEALENDDIDEARTNLAMITKRKTKDLDKNHVLSGVLESISENTVDGVTGPLFYFALFGLPGAFVYRVINTIDSMIGYKTAMFRNLGWFGANCDNVLNYLPSRITGLVMVLASMLLGNDWKQSYEILKKDSCKTSSPNAGYPMAALAGALDTKFQKVDHYSIGAGLKLSFNKTCAFGNSFNEGNYNSILWNSYHSDNYNFIILGVDNSCLNKSVQYFHF